MKTQYSDLLASRPIHCAVWVVKVSLELISSSWACFSAREASSLARVA